MSAPKNLLLSAELLLVNNHSEKRLFQRLDVHLEVELKVDGKPIRTTTTNISCGGMFLKVDPEQLKRGQDLRLQIHLPNRNQPIEVSGRILRRADDLHGREEGIALQFEELYNDNILAIEQFIKSNLH